MPERLTDRVCVVTGAASGIGQAVAELFVAEGAAVVAGDINVRGLAGLQDRLGPRCAVLETDVTHEGAVEALMQLAVSRFGRLDVGINCAGYSYPTVLIETTADKWNADINLNLTGAFFSLKHAARRMKSCGNGGVIIAVTSVTSRVGAVGMGPYAAAKAGLQHLVRIASIELASDGIRVVGIGPGLIETPLTATMLENEAVVAAYLRSVPLARPGQAMEVARAALFLASSDASYITGEVLMVDGGQQGVGWSRGQPKPPVAT